MHMSSDLRQFYTAYAAWLRNGAPQNAPFNRGCGLCSNARIFARKASIWCESVDELYQELLHQFHNAAFDNPYYPFGGIEVYHREATRGTAYLNPARIAWVHKHAIATGEKDV